MKKNLMIMGEWGKEFHLYSKYYKNSNKYNVSLFTSPKIKEEKIYPLTLAGKNYDCGIPVKPEVHFIDYLQQYHIHEVVFSGANVSYEWISQKEKIIRQNFADFRLAEIERIMLPSSQKVIAVRNVFPNEENYWFIERIAKYFSERKKHLLWPLFSFQYEDFLTETTHIYKDLSNLQLFPDHPLFSTFLSCHTIVTGGNWSHILDTCQNEAGAILAYQQGNDVPLIKPDIYITVLDMTRDDYKMYYPGVINLELASIIVLCGRVTKEKEECVREDLHLRNPESQIFCDSEVEKVLEILQGVNTPE